MRALINKIKKQETFLFRWIYKLVRLVLTFSVPVNSITKPIFMFIYSGHIFVKDIIRFIVRFFYTAPLFKSQCSQLGAGLFVEKLPYITGWGNIHIGNNVHISGKINIGFSGKIYSKPTLKIGDNVFIGNMSVFVAAQEISIGDNCLIASNVVIRDNDGHPLDFIKRRSNLPPNKESVKPVKVGNDVWIGRGAVIAKGVTVGDRAIVGELSMVTKDVPPDTIVAGNPAVIIRKLV